MKSLGNDKAKITYVTKLFPIMLVSSSEIFDIFNNLIFCSVHLQACIVITTVSCNTNIFNGYFILGLSLEIS